MLKSYIGGGDADHIRIRGHDLVEDLLDKHDFVDVLAGAAIGVGMSYLFTKRYDERKKLGISSGLIENTPTIYLTYKF